MAFDASKAVEGAAHSGWVTIALAAIAAFFGGGKVFEWLAARTAAGPDAMEAKTGVFGEVFDRLEGELTRQTATIENLTHDLAKVREHNNRLLEAFDAVRRYALNLLHREGELRSTIEELGIEPPSRVTSVEHDIEHLMRGPVAFYTPDDHHANTGT